MSLDLVDSEVENKSTEGQVLSPFYSFVSELKGQRIYLDELAGNNGDTLILRGMRHVLQQTGSALVDDPAKADVIMLNGGGAMNDLWPSGAAQVYDSYVARFPEKQFVVGPSSYYFRSLDFPSIIEKCQSKVTLFCRESISEALLNDMGFSDKVAIRTSQDLAFELRNAPLVTELKQTLAEKHILFAIRKDLEGHAGVMAKVRAPWLPRIIRLPLSKLRDRLAAMMNDDLISTIVSEAGLSKSKAEKIFRDVSVSVDFAEFCRLIAEAKLIVTDRLHVAILGAMLGKQVRLIRGQYHKAEGVYNYSLRDDEKVKLY